VGEVDVVVVSYNSRETLRACVAPLATLPGVRVIVADNASADGSLETLDGLPVTTLRLPRNGGFSYGCNAGWRAGQSPRVLFINPDADIDGQSLTRLIAVLDGDETVGAAAPRIVNGDGSLHHSQRRFPRLRSTFAQAFFLHRVATRAHWVDELVLDETAYRRPGSPEWVSGACLLVRRSALEALGGLDEGFFLYAEDMDLCRRLRSAGYEIRFVPEAVCRHQGGASAPRASLLPVLAESRLRYARKHERRPVAALTRLGVALGAATHMLLARGRAARAGHASALRVALAGGREHSRTPPTRAARRREGADPNP
jgi:N-acetylglucosaminyl-diphospho-decaprenol L-rhamnosyltransferase